MSSNTDLWGTPIKLFEALDREFNFKVDVCADETNHKCPVYFDKAQDGLKQDWIKYGSVFMNPPYGRDIGKWTHKAVLAARGGGAVVVAVLPCRCDTKWFRDVAEATEIRIISGRLNYNDGPSAAPFPSCVVIWGTPKMPRMSWITQQGEKMDRP